MKAGNECKKDANEGERANTLSFFLFFFPELSLFRPHGRNLTGNECSVASVAGLQC